MKHNINQSLPWIVCEPHARLHAMSNGSITAARHHTPVTRFPDESKALAYMVERNALDERLARLGSTNPHRNNKRYVAYSVATYADVVAAYKEQQAIDEMVNKITAMAVQ